jgi:short subunit dehydrogenase-like uncharacterized protein
MSGSASGGTAATILALGRASANDRDLRRLLANPHALDANHTHPRAEKAEGRSPRDAFEADPRTVTFDRDIDRWTAPFFMAPVNTRIVRRSNALLQYGKAFRYRETMSLPRGAKGWAAGYATTMGLGAFLLSATLRPTRALLARFVLPKPGEGPSAEARARGHFTVRFVGSGTDASGAALRLRATVKGTSDPGYGETAKMLGESALCLAADARATGERFGVLTPASAMGMTLVRRLRARGMTFDVS